MHVPHHMPAPEPNARPLPRKPVRENEETGPYARIAEQGDGRRQRGSKSSPRRRERLDATQGAGSETDGPRGKAPSARPVQPFMAMTEVTTFWKRLVALSETDSDGSGSASATPAVERSLMDLFSKAIKSP